MERYDKTEVGKERRNSAKTENDSMQKRILGIVSNNRKKEACWLEMLAAKRNTATKEREQSVARWNVVQGDFFFHTS